MDRISACGAEDPGSIPGGRTFCHGGLAEWFMAHASKACGRKPAGVQILYPPQRNNVTAFVIFLVRYLIQLDYEAT